MKRIVASACWDMRGSLASSLARVSADRDPDAPRRAPLRATGLEKRFGTREALRGVDIDAAAGEVLAVIGPNGAGKTTLLEILAGAQRADAGEVRRADPATRVGWVPQQLAVYGRLSVAENMRLFTRLERVADVEGRVAAMLAETGLSDRADDLVETLSGGNRQRVNVAVGLLGDPAVVLLDEPSASLDPRQRERLWGFLDGRAAAGTSIVVTTHDVAEARRHAGRVLVLADGEALFLGPPEQIAGAERADHDYEVALLAFLEERGH